MFETDEPKRTYVSVINSHFVIKVGAGEGAERITKSGKKVFEKSFNRLVGRIVNVKKKTTEWEGKKIVSWEVKLVDNENTAVLSLNCGSTEASSFLSILPNVSLDDEVTLNIFPYAAPGKKEHTYITIYQFGKKLDKFFTKENLPQLKKIVFKGEERWDDTEQQAVFEKKVLELFPLVKKDEQEVPEDGVGVGNPDDLPF